VISMGTGGKCKHCCHDDSRRAPTRSKDHRPRTGKGSLGARPSERGFPSDALRATSAVDHAALPQKCSARSTMWKSASF
jgi:hypothetical protein